MAVGSALGIAGIATAYSTGSSTSGITDIVLVDAGLAHGVHDRRDPGTTTATGGRTRRWRQLTNRSIDLMERIAGRTGNRIGMTRRGYALATREIGIDHFVEELQFGFGDASGRFLRTHSHAGARTYRPPRSGNWEDAPDGVDILRGQHLIRDGLSLLRPGSLGP